MTVNELIKLLESLPNKDRPIKFFFNWEKYTINSLADNRDEILLGDDLPPEVYEKDYKNERA